MNFRYKFLVAALFIAIALGGLYNYSRHKSDLANNLQLQALLARPKKPFHLDSRTQSANCKTNGSFPDHACTSGGVFPDATVDQICSFGYSKNIRNVPVGLKKEVYAEYGLAYPQARGAYEVDHLIPLELGGNNDIGNLFPEASDPAPGFREKDVVENYLHEEVCAGRVALSVAQEQIATDWLAVYNALSPAEIQVLKEKFKSWSY